MAIQRIRVWKLAVRGNVQNMAPRRFVQEALSSRLSLDVDVLFLGTETWLLKAANQEYPEAEENLALLYLNKGPLHSEDKSFTWYSRAAEHGRPDLSNRDATKSSLTSDASRNSVSGPPVAMPLVRAYTVMYRRELRTPARRLCLPSERNLMGDTLQTVASGRLLRLAMNRPDKRNALNLALCIALVDAIEAADRDPGVGAILLSGNGKSFCAGMDLQEIADTDREAVSQVHEQLFTIGARLRKPLIADVRGAALAGGTGLVANCHIVIASEDATFGLTEIRLGLWPFLVFRAVAAAVGERRSVELALTGRIVGASEARDLGLVHRVGGDAAEIAAALAESSPTAIQSGLRFVQEARGKDWTEAGEISQRARRELFETADFEEGIRAFREKRRPRWPSISALRPEKGA